MRYIQTALLFAMAGGLLRYWTALDEMSGATGESTLGAAYLGLAGSTLLLEGAFLGGIAGYAVAWLWGPERRSPQPEDTGRRTTFSEELGHRQAPRPKKPLQPSHPVVQVRKK